MVAVRVRYCQPVSSGKQEWVKGVKDRWTCKGCGRSGLQIRHRHRSWPKPVLIPVWGDWRGARNEIITQARVSPIDAYMQDWKWRINRSGYIYRQTWITVKGKRKRHNLFMHRIILKLTPGDALEGHHRDTDPTNMQRWNLEVTTRSENEKYKHYRNIRNGTLSSSRTASAEPIPDDHTPAHRETLKQIIKNLCKEFDFGFALRQDVMREAMSSGLTDHQATSALERLTLMNSVYHKGGKGTFALL